MRTLVFAIALFALAGAVAAPTASADPVPDPPAGFGTCVITEQTVGNDPVTGEPIVVPDYECYW